MACSSGVTGSASLTLSFSVARISSLLKKETEGSECQQAKATLQPVAGAAWASLGTRQDVLDTCPVLGAELLLGQPAAPHRKAFLPPQGWGTQAPHPTGNPALSYRMVPRKVDFSGVEPTYRMCTLAKRELMLQTCPEEKRNRCQHRPALTPAHPAQARQGR